MGSNWLETHFSSARCKAWIRVRRAYIRSLTPQRLPRSTKCDECGCFVMGCCPKRPSTLATGPDADWPGFLRFRGEARRGYG